MRALTPRDSEESKFWRPAAAIRDSANGEKAVAMRCLLHRSACRGSRSALRAKRGDRSSTSKRPPVSDVSLISVLRDEMKVERDFYRRDESLLDGPPNGFEIDDTPGKNSFFLLKNSDHDEGVEIEVDLESQPSSDDVDEFDGSGDDDNDGSPGEDEEDEEVVPVVFKCSISKGGSVLIFDCESDGDSIDINHISYVNATRSQKEGEGGEDEEEGEIDDLSKDYSGPVFEDLDETLKQAFLDYLEERGVTSELGEYLRSACLDKQAREYVSWLQKVRDFVGR